MELHGWIYIPQCHKSHFSQKLLALHILPLFSFSDERFLVLPPFILKGREVVGCVVGQIVQKVGNINYITLLFKPLMEENANTTQQLCDHIIFTMTK